MKTWGSSKQEVVMKKVFQVKIIISKYYELIRKLKGC
jgi:hypothetical protein